MKLSEMSGSVRTDRIGLGRGVRNVRCVLDTGHSDIPRTAEQWTASACRQAIGENKHMTEHTEPEAEKELPISTAQSQQQSAGKY